jgi:hypothetical protein
MFATKPESASNDPGSWVPVADRKSIDDGILVLAYTYKERIDRTCVDRHRRLNPSWLFSCLLQLCIVKGRGGPQFSFLKVNFFNSFEVKFRRLTDSRLRESRDLLRLLHSLVRVVAFVWNRNFNSSA